MTEVITGAMPEPENDRLSVIAAAIRKAYGDEAITVAQRQVEAAEGEAKADWIAILAHLRR